MKKKIFPIVKSALGLLLLALLYKIFIPVYYSIPPLEKRAGTRFMELSTGSIIAYTKFDTQTSKQPYPIIYLHGGPGGFISDVHIEVLSNLVNDGYDVFLYDQIGSGASARLNDIDEYTVERHINDLHEIIKKLGKEKVILIGQSWGGILAAYYVSKYPKEVAKIIFSNPGPIYPYPNELNYIKAPDSLHLQPPVFTNAQGNAKVKNIRNKAMNFFAVHFGIKLAIDKEADEFATYAGYKINKSTVYDTSKAIKMLTVKSTPRSGYYAEIMTFKSLLKMKDPRPALAGLDIPVLVLKSQYDNQIWGGTNEYVEIFKNHHLEIIPNAGHSIIRENSGLFLKYIRQFLSE